MPIMLRRTGNLSSAFSDSVVIVPPSSLVRYWHLAEPLIQRMLNRGRGEYALSDVYEALYRGRKDLWFGKRDEKVVACLVGEVHAYPRYSVYLIFGFAADDMKYWLERLDRIEAHAVSKGCVCLEEWGRGGWEKVLTDWEKAHVVMRKPL